MVIKQRQSNIEALRIVAMLLVLVVHCCFMSNGNVSSGDLRAEPFATSLYLYVEALALCCVDCYVLISGYFGIKPRWRGLFNLLFIVWFWRLIFLAVGWMWTGVSPTVVDMLMALNPFKGNWFVAAYLGLYIMSYFLNAFADHATKDEFRTGLLAYLATMLVLGWLLPASLSPILNFSNGYSVFTFVGLYLLGRYIRLHYNSHTWSRRRLVGLYALSAFVNALIYIVLTLTIVSPFVLSMSKDWFVSYDSIFTITAGVALLVLSTKFDFQNRWVNWFAASSFAVFLIHTNPSVKPYFIQAARMIKDWSWPWGWLPLTLLYCAAVYVAGTLIDQVRIAAWRGIECLINNEKRYA